MMFSQRYFGKTLKGLGIMVFNATFNNISVIYRDRQFYWWRKPQ